MDALYGRPDGDPVVLRRAPVMQDPLAEEPTDPRAFLDGLTADLDWGPRSGTHLALDLTVGVEDDDPLRGHELDTYLFPMVNRLGQVRFDAVFARKVPGGRSWVTVGPALPAEPVLPAPIDVRPTTPATSIEWKEQVHAAARAVTPEPAPDGPVTVRIRFTLSRRRNWTALWTPALDALGPVLGVPDPSRPYRAQDDRICALDLHRRFDDTVGDRVRLEVWWEPGRPGQG